MTFAKIVKDEFKKNKTRTLAELGLYIHVAKISTKVDQAADTFYVKDIFGQTISDEFKREHIHTALLECMEE